MRWVAVNGGEGCGEWWRGWRFGSEVEMSGSGGRWMVAVGGWLSGGGLIERVVGKYGGGAAGVWRWWRWWYCGGEVVEVVVLTRQWWCCGGEVVVLWR